jgi:hypothetical protein
VGLKTAKIRKNRMNYYFLTQLGEAVYDKAFGTKDSGFAKREPMELKEILGNLASDGWHCSMEGGELLTLKNGERNLPIHMKNTIDRKPFDPKETFFLCSSNKVKNITIQKAARMSAEFRKGFTIFISTAADFAESGELEEIEFIV